MQTVRGGAEGGLNMRHKPADPTNPTEYDDQCKVIAWARMMVETGQEPRLDLLHGDSSGVRVPIGCAVKMKRAGAIKGFPDLFLPIMSGTFSTAPENTLYHFGGLFIELKRRKGGRVSPEQSIIHEMLRRNGYHVEVCRGADAAIEAIKWYLGIEP
jgi:hypothetical protein